MISIVHFVQLSPVGENERPTVTGEAKSDIHGESITHGQSHDDEHHGDQVDQPIVKVRV